MQRVWGYIVCILPRGHQNRKTGGLSSDQVQPYSGCHTFCDLPEGGPVPPPCRFSTVPPEGHLTMIWACLLTGRRFPFPLNPVPPPLPPGPTGSDFDIISLFTGPLITSPISAFLPQGLCTGHSLCLNILSSLLGLANCLTLLLCSQPLPPLPNLTPPQLSSALSLLLLTGQSAS